MRIVITGATGYVGKNLIDLIDKEEHSIYAVVSSEQATFPDHVTQILINDNLDTSVLETCPDIIVHLASHLTPKAETEDIEKLVNANILFGSRILNSLKKSSLKYFINVGTFAEFHYNDGQFNPTYYYAATKTAFRSILKYYSELIGFKVVHVIPYSIYGGRDTRKKVIDLLFESLNAREPVKLSSGLQSLDFIHINDVLDFFILLIRKIEQIKDGENLFLGTGKAFNLRQVAALIEQTTGLSSNISWGAVASRERDTLFASAPVVRLKELLNWEPTISLEQGIKIKTNEFFKYDQ